MAPSDWSDPMTKEQKHLITASADVFDLTAGTADTVGVFVCPEAGAAENAEGMAHGTYFRVSPSAHWMFCVHDTEPQENPNTVVAAER